MAREWTIDSLLGRIATAEKPNVSAAESWSVMSRSHGWATDTRRKMGRRKQSPDRRIYRSVRSGERSESMNVIESKDSTKIRWIFERRRNERKKKKKKEKKKEATTLVDDGCPIDLARPHS